MKTIWIDLTDIILWPLKHLTGIQRVVINTSVQMRKLDNKIQYFHFDNEAECFLVIDPETLHYATTSDIEKIVVTKEKAQFHEKDTLLFLGGSWVCSKLIPEIIRMKDEKHFDVIHFIHDVTPIKVKHTHREKSREIMENWLVQLSQCVDKYITNSHFSKNEITSVFEYMNLPIKEIKVVRLGDEIDFDLTVADQATEETEYLINKNFALCVGSFEPRKNHLILYQTWKLLYQKDKDNTPILVIVGSKGWLTDDIKSLILRDPELENKLIWLSNIREESLIWLYRHCKFTIYPSLYEGWGLPVAESLNLGVPCLASNAASIPEIAANTIDYFNPYNSQECFNLVDQYFNDIEILDRAKERIKVSFKKTTWKQTAEECLNYI